MFDLGNIHIIRATLYFKELLYRTDFINNNIPLSFDTFTVVLPVKDIFIRKEQ